MLWFYGIAGISQSNIIIKVIKLNVRGLLRLITAYFFLNSHNTKALFNYLTGMSSRKMSWTRKIVYIRGKRQQRFVFVYAGSAD